MTLAFHIKRGATFQLDGIFADDYGTAIDLTGVQLTSNVLDTLGNLVGPLAVTVNDAPLGMMTLSATNAQTAAWPLGMLHADVCFTQNGVSIYSDTFRIAVSQPSTPPP